MENETKRSRIQNMTDVVNGNISDNRSSASNALYSQSRNGIVSFDDMDLDIRDDEISAEFSAAESSSSRRRVSQVDMDSQTTSERRTAATSRSSERRTSASTNSERRVRPSSSTGRSSSSSRSTSSERSSASERTSSGSGSSTQRSRQTSSSRTSSSQSARKSSDSSRTASSRTRSSAENSRTAASSRTTAGSTSRSSGKTVRPQSRSTVGKKNTTAANRKYSDIVGERINRNNSSKKKSSKKKGGKFKIALIVYAAVWVLIMIIGGIIFSSYLKAYEDSQPKYTAEAIVNQYESTEKLTKFINANSDQIQCLDDLDTFISQYTASVEGKKISFITTDESTAEAPQYMITADGTDVGTVTLAKDGTGSFGYDKWKMAKYDIISSWPDARSFDLLVPEGSTVTINGIELDDSYVTGTGIPSILEKSAEYIKEVPTFTTYAITVLTNDPEVAVKDASGNDMVVSTSETTFVAGGTASDEFIESVERIVNAGIDEWAHYFVHTKFNLSLYILQGTELYGYIFGDDDNYGVQTDLYNYEQIVSDEFEYSSAENYIVYADDCFSVDVKYKLDMRFSESGMSDNNQLIDATWVWVRDGDSWSISDCIYH